MAPETQNNNTEKQPTLWSKLKSWWKRIALLIAVSVLIAVSFYVPVSWDHISSIMTVSLDRIRSILALLLIAVSIYGLCTFVFRYQDLKDSSLVGAFYIELKIIGSTAFGLILLINAIALHDSAQTEKERNQQDLFNKAIINLGNGSESVRLGGIYALYNLAKNDKYTKNVHEILCAHVRSKTNEKTYKKQYKVKPSTEIQGLLDILTQQDKSKAFEEVEDLRVNFTDAYLRGADLFRAQLQRANLGEAQLQGADLKEAELQGAYLFQAELQGAHLGEAKLQGADLRYAQLQGADLKEAELQGADLFQAQLQGAYLFQAQLQGAHLGEAQLQGTYSVGHEILFNFKGRIKQRVGKETELDTVILAGEMTATQLEEIKRAIDLDATHWDDDNKEELQELLEKLAKDHVDKGRITGKDEAGAEYLKESKIGAGTYTQEDADEWIDNWIKHQAIK